MAWVTDDFGKRVWVPDRQPAPVQQTEFYNMPDAAYTSAVAQRRESAGVSAPQKGGMFGDLFKDAMSGSAGSEFGEDVPKGQATFAGSSPLQGQYAKQMPMAPWSQAQAPSGYGQVERFRPKKKLFEGYKPWALMG